MTNRSINLVSILSFLLGCNKTLIVKTGFLRSNGLLYVRCKNQSLYHMYIYSSEKNWLQMVILDDHWMIQDDPLHQCVLHLDSGMD